MTSNEIKGVGEGVPVVADAKGGLSSKLDYRFDLIPPEALFKVAQVFEFGAKKYAINNWRLVDRHTHINHALVHLFAYMAGDTQDDHLGHATTRLLMALTVEEDGFPYVEPPKDIK